MSSLAESLDRFLFAARRIAADRERVLVIVEGRDGSGKTSLVREIARHLPPDAHRVVSLSRPTDEEKRGPYFRRYLEHLPRPGEIVLFDRSWYGRAGVERVMGFCTEEEVEAFFQAVPDVEANLVREGLRLVKIYLRVSEAEQARRLERRASLTTVDASAVARAADYARAEEEMLARTSTSLAPWKITPDYEDERAKHAHVIGYLAEQLEKERWGSA